MRSMQASSASLSTLKLRTPWSSAYSISSRDLPTPAKVHFSRIAAGREDAKQFAAGNDVEPGALARKQIEDGAVRVRFDRVADQVIDLARAPHRAVGSDRESCPRCRRRAAFRYSSATRARATSSQWSCRRDNGTNAWRYLRRSSSWTQQRDQRLCSPRWEGPLCRDYPRARRGWDCSRGRGGRAGNRLSRRLCKAAPARQRYVPASRRNVPGIMRAPCNQRRPFVTVRRLAPAAKRPFVTVRRSAPAVRRVAPEAARAYCATIRPRRSTIYAGKWDSNFAAVSEAIDQ